MILEVIIGTIIAWIIVMIITFALLSNVAFVTWMTKKYMKMIAKLEDEIEEDILQSKKESVELVQALFLFAMFSILRTFELLPFFPQLIAKITRCFTESK